MENVGNQKLFIYGLYEIGKENEIRYIGKSNNPESRVYSHVHVSMKNKNKLTHKECWIKKVINSGNKIGFKILEEVNCDNWSEREIFWISTTSNLTNTSPGGETGITGKLFEISYTEYKSWINKNYPNLKSRMDFRGIINYLPDFLPKSPNTVFKNYGWISWQELLNTKFETSREKKKKYLPYIECKNWIKENYPIVVSWNEIQKKLPYFIPKRPYIAYKNTGWTNWIDFIGIDLSPKTYLNFAEAKNYVRNLNLSSSKDWYEYYLLNHKKESFPKIPKNVVKVYSKDGWKGWTDFLGSKIKAMDVYRNKLSYDDLIIYVRENLSHIRSKRKWVEYIEKNNFPEIPRNPNTVYKDQWIDWNTFLNKTDFKRNKTFYTFDECKEIIKKSGIKTNKEWREWVKNTEGIPKSPESFFKNEWIDWYDWLGKKKCESN
jgi:hypothetical protein